jgi:hypothetical protein
LMKFKCLFLQSSLLNCNGVFHTKLTMTLLLFFFWYIIYFNLTSQYYKEIVFKSVVWKKGDESFQKCRPGFGCRIEPRSSHTGVVCATVCATPHPHTLLLWNK